MNDRFHTLLTEQKTRGWEFYTECSIGQIVCAIMKTVDRGITHTFSFSTMKLVFTLVLVMPGIRRIRVMRIVPVLVPAFVFAVVFGRSDNHAGCCAEHASGKE